jgi:hypothetical protein
MKRVKCMHTDNGLPPSVLFGRVSCSSSGDRIVPWLKKSSMVWIWQHDKRTDDYMIIFNLSMNIDEKMKFFEYCDLYPK